MPPVVHQFLGRSYVRANREAHRRSATRLDPPGVSLYVGLHRPRKWNKTFVEFFSALLASLNGAARGSTEYCATQAQIDDFVRAVSNHYDIDRADADDRSFKLTRDFPDHRWKRGKWRVEAHREFIGISLYVGLEITGQRTLALSLAAREPDLDSGRLAGEALTIKCVRGLSAKPGHSTISAALFGKLCEELQIRFDPILEAASSFYDSDGGVEDKVFALLYGAVVPWTLLRDAAALKHVDPEFPLLDAAGLKPARVNCARQKTNVFMTEVWPALEGALVTSNNSDCVACYMLGGHCLYVSSLGSENTAEPEPLKYLVMYQDPILDGAARVPPVAVGAGDVRGRCTNPPYNVAWRMSRFIGRLHDLGSARLMALGHQEEISRFLIMVRRIEARLSEEKAYRNGPELRSIEDDFRAATRNLRVPITRLSSRIRHKMGLVDRLAADLGVISLPTFQPYDQFLRRRVIGTLERMCAAGDRYETILRKLNSANISNQSGEILRIQKIADMVGILVFIYYAMQFAYYLVDHAHHAGVGAPLVRFDAHGVALAAMVAASTFILWQARMTLAELFTTPATFLTRWTRDLRGGTPATLDEID